MEYPSEELINTFNHSLSSFKEVSFAYIQELGEELADLAGFRNVLVHIYWRLDIQRIHEILQHGLTFLRQFRDATIQVYPKQV